MNSWFWGALLLAALSVSLIVRDLWTRPHARPAPGCVWVCAATVDHLACDRLCPMDAGVGP